MSQFTDNPDASLAALEIGRQPKEKQFELRMQFEIASNLRKIVEELQLIRKSNMELASSISSIARTQNEPKKADPEQ